MTLASPSVDTPGDAGAFTPRPSLYGWDWSATTHEGRQGIVDDLLAALGAEAVVMGKGLQGWVQSAQAFDVGGYKTGAVYFGGRDDVHVVSTSSAAHDARAAVVGIGEARTSRVDTRVDTLMPFDDLRGVLEDVAGPRTKIMYVEGYQGGGEHRQDTGRTLYIGAPTSAVRVRLYEKWLEAGTDAQGRYLYAEGTNRVEVQLRPPSRAKEKVSTWGPADTFCASKLTRRLAAALEEDVVNPGSLQKSKGVPDLERTLAAMGEQYGPAVGRWLDVNGGAGWDKVFGYLRGTITPQG